MLRHRQRLGAKPPFRSARGAFAAAAAAGGGGAGDSRSLWHRGEGNPAGGAASVPRHAGDDAAGPARPGRDDAVPGAQEDERLLHPRNTRPTSDSAPRAPVAPCIKNPRQTEQFGNPHSRTHLFGWESESAVEAARRQVASLIGADEKEIVFTSGATEANNMALKGIPNFYREKKRHIITTQTEHKARGRDRVFLVVCATGPRAKG